MKPGLRGVYLMDACANCAKKMRISRVCFPAIRPET